MSNAPISSGAACSSSGPCCVIAGSIGTLARIALGALFIFSGVVKLNDPQAFAFAIKGFKLVEDHDLIVQAITREKTIKKWPRQWKINLIEQTNPHWQDLSWQLL